MTDQTDTTETLENYVLGRITDEEILESIEDRLAVDEEFSQLLGIVEDELIERFTGNSLDIEKRKDFEKIYLGSKILRQKISYVKALQNSAGLAEIEPAEAAHASAKKSGWFGVFFLSPRIAFGSVALMLVFLAAFVGWLFILNPGETNDYVARLDSLYKNNRPVEGRIIDFEYSPYVALRGDREEKNDAKQRTRRKIENELIEAIERNSTSENHNLLGVFYLTEGKYAESIKEFEHALEINEDNTEARSNLGVAYFEKSKLEAEDAEKLKLKARALEESSKAINEGNVKPETLFNKALILQEMNIPRQAIEAWKEYLKADGTSKWAEEARKNLSLLEKNKNTSFKTKDQILRDFLAAFDRQDETRAWMIHSQTKEFNSNKFLPSQLTAKYLETEQIGDTGTAEKYLRALKFIGDLEKRKNNDLFFQELAVYYENLPEIKKKLSIRLTNA